MASKKNIDTTRFNQLLKTAKYDESAFEELYLYYYPSIINRVYYKYGNRNLGIDVAQEFFLEILKMDGSKHVEYPTSWVHAVCDNLFKKLMIKSGKDLLLPNEVLSTFSREASFPEIFGEYTEKLKLLDEKTQEVIRMHLFEGYTLQEYARISNLNYETARKRYQRGLKKLEKMK